VIRLKNAQKPSPGDLALCSARSGARPERGHVMDVSAIEESGFVFTLIVTRV